MYVRTTFMGNTNTMLDRLFSSQSNLQKTQEQATSLKKILAPSDNPLGTAVVMSANKQLSDIQGFKDNLGILDSETSLQDSLFANMLDKMDRLSDLAISGSTGTNLGEGSMGAIRDEVTELKKILVDLANTKYNDKYIFSGSNTSTPPYVLEDDGSITYHGTETLNPDGTVDYSQTSYQRQIEISEGVFINVNFAGDSVFGTYDATTTPPGGSGIFKVISDFEANLNATPINQDDIRDRIDEIKAGIDKLSEFRTKNGINAQRVELTKTSLDDNEILMMQDKANVQEYDMTEIYTKLSQEMYAYQASLQITSSMHRTSLLDYM